MKRRKNHHKNTDIYAGLVRIILKGLMVVFIVLVVIVGVYMASQYRQRTWTGHDPYRLILTDTKETYVVLEILNEPLRLGFIQLPKDVMMEVMPASYGVYRLGALYELSELDNLDEKLLINTFTFQLGMFIDDVLASDSFVFDERAAYSSIVRYLRTAIVRGDINAVDGVRVLNAVSEVDPSLMKVTSLDDKDVYQRTLVGDFLSQRSFEPSFLSDYLNRWQPVGSANEAIYSAMVVNTTGKAGLAANMMRILNREGMRVLGIGDQEDVYDESMVLVKDSAYEDIQAQSTFAGIRIVSESDSENTLDNREDLRVYLGLDILE